MKYRYRVGWFGKIILQVGIVHDETEMDPVARITVPTGRKDVHWRDATFQDITEHQTALAQHNKE
jgi:hypothetical protein